MLMNLMNYFNTYVKSRINNEKGQGMVEYGLVIAVVAIVLIGAFTGLGTKLSTLLTNIGNKLTIPE